MEKTKGIIAGEFVKALEPRVCSTCLFDSTIAHIHENGQCEYCVLQKDLASKSLGSFSEKAAEIANAGRNKKYDCLIGISGGEDSSVMLYLAVMRWKLRPLVIHFNNGWNAPEATNNIQVLVQKLSVDYIEYKVNHEEYKQLNRAFVAASVPDADIPNDIAMAKLMDTAAKQYDIKYILNGHDFRNEGSSPKVWSKIDAKYIESVYSWYTQGLKLKNYPLYTFWDQLVAGWKGIKQVRPFHYEAIPRAEILSKLRMWGWQDYGSKHCENVYTEFVGNFLLPVKFGIDKRRTYLSARMREGTITREFAHEMLAMSVTFDLTKLGSEQEMLLTLARRLPPVSRDLYPAYNFRKYKFFVWVLSKLGVVPHTFYVKYAR